VAQHATLVDRQRSAHAAFLGVLRDQLDAASRALDEYEKVTSKAERTFGHAVVESKRAQAEGVAGGGGALAAVDAILGLRQALLTSERISQERYRTAVGVAAEKVRDAIDTVAEEALV